MTASMPGETPPPLIAYRGPEMPAGEVLIVSVLPCAGAGCFKRIDGYPARPLGQPEDELTRKGIEDTARHFKWTKRFSWLYGVSWLCEDCTAGKPTLLGDLPARLARDKGLLTEYTKKVINMDNIKTEEL